MFGFAYPNESYDETWFCLSKWITTHVLEVAFGDLVSWPLF